MRTPSRKSGFSLVELLTVIAIIAILASIIFPVMNAVKQKAQETDCMTRLHQIQLGLDLYKKDNRKFPPALCVVKLDAGGTTMETFENAKGDYLYAQYVKTIRSLHCPASKVTSTAEWATYPSVPYNTGVEPVMVTVYAYDSFDCQVSGVAEPVTKQYLNAEQHYALDWAPDAAYLSTSAAPPIDPFAGSSASAVQTDYERQLKFRNPPDDTVITWCSNHANGDRSLVVFLDGNVVGYQGSVANTHKWRIRPKKE